MFSHELLISDPWKQKNTNDHYILSNKIRMSLLLEYSTIRYHSLSVSVEILFSICTWDTTSHPCASMWCVTACISRRFTGKSKKAAVRSLLITNTRIRCGWNNGLGAVTPLSGQSQRWFNLVTPCLYFWHLWEAQKIQMWTRKKSLFFNRTWNDELDYLECKNPHK